MIKKAKQKPRVDQSNLVERGMTNGHIKMTSTKNTPQQQPQPVLSPRVTLQSTVRSSRPRSTIPNYIEDTSDEDDFDPGRVKPHTNPLSSYGEQQKQNRTEILLTPKSLML